MAYTDEFGNIFGTSEDIINAENYGWGNIFSNPTDDYGNYIPWESPAWDTSNFSRDFLSQLDLSGLSGVSRLFSGAANALSGAFKKPDGSTDWRAVASAGGALAPLLENMLGGGNRPASYQGEIPKYAAVREQVPGTYDPNRRPGSGGQRYFTDVQYAKDADLDAARAAAAEQAQGIAALNAANQASERKQPEEAPAQQMAKGGIVGLQDGGFVVPADVVSHLGNGSSRAGINHLARKGAMPIQGRGDGMSDSNRTTINGRQPAAVADGEAYFPPKQVENMGGADRLYAMMDKIRKDRTGTTKQGKQINPNQYV